MPAQLSMTFDAATSTGTAVLTGPAPLRPSRQDCPLSVISAPHHLPEIFRSETLSGL
jgi:hypothetical protein